MTEPLVVDSSQLKAAGAGLQRLTLPAPPAPMAVSAPTDSLSAAIDETLPIIESPVIAGLRNVDAALTRTGSNIAIAAGIYADTDRRLGEHTGQAQIGADTEKARRGGSADRPVGVTRDRGVGSEAGQPEDGEKVGRAVDDGRKPSAPGTSVPQFGQVASQLGQIAGAVGGAAQGAVQSVQGAGPVPAQVTGEVQQKQSSAEQVQLVDATGDADSDKDQRPEAVVKGAAPGHQTSQNPPPSTPAPRRPSPGQPVV